MHGFLNIDKPAGITSHDVVAQVRRVARQKRVGHAGTLDPAATGVLVVALGQATRLIEYVQDDTSKGYHALVRLGQRTATDDAEGEALETLPVPPLDADALETTLRQFRGPIMQVPPMYSALHHNGQRLYDLARKGETVDLPARPVQIDELTLSDWHSPDLTLDIRCSKGTYIRSLARDIGAALGCGAHLAALRRTAVGAFTLADATPLGELSPDRLAAVLLPPVWAVRDWPQVKLDNDVAQWVRNGLPLDLPEQGGEQVAALDPDGQLLAVLERRDGRWSPTKVFTWPQ